MSQTNDLAISIIRKTRSHVDNTCDRYGNLMRAGLVTHPIPYFGRLSNAKVVTLGLNPSSKEFTNNRNWPQLISSEDLRDRLCGYFDSVAPPPHRFFEQWSRSLAHINASYKLDTVHLDLSPRATRSARQLTAAPLRSLFLKMLRADSCIWIEAIEAMNSVEIILAAGSATNQYYINEFIKEELFDIGVRLEGNWQRGQGPGQTAFHILILPNGRQVPMFFCSTGPAAPHDPRYPDGVLVHAVRTHAMEINKWRKKGKD
jgi:hypothetical protein